MYLNVRVVLAKSFERIHRANLINFGILPLTFSNPADFEKIQAGEHLLIDDIHSQLKSDRLLTLQINNEMIEVVNDLSEEEREVILAGGMLTYISSKSGI